MRSEHTPTRLKSIYWLFALEVGQCASCKRPMMPILKQGFPSRLDYRQENQMEAAGIVEQSYSTVNGDKICKICESEGKASFTCDFCGIVRSSDMLHDSYPHVCTICYETLPKKVWDEKEREFEESHKYDYY